MLPPLQVLVTVRRQLLIRRRTLAALCVGLAVWTGIGALTAAPPRTVPVLTATRDLAAGTTLTPDDLTRTGFAPGSVPPSAVRQPGRAVGRTLLAPLGRGEPLGSGHLLGGSALTGYPGQSAIGLRIPDPDAAGLLRVGDRVDLVASDPQGDGAAERLVRDAVVLALPPHRNDFADSGPTTGGRLVLFAVPSDGVDHVAAVASTHFLTVVWNR